MGNKLHGYTRITLRNPISGNILKDVESENTFQGSVIAQYLRTLGTNSGVLEYNDVKINELWKTAVGGLFLFQNAETVGNMYMSAGNRMIGNASYGYSNASIPNELGSFNSQESSSSASAIKQVYDFATNQANGQIGCVCLTSQVGGYMGYGNASEDVDSGARNGWSEPVFQSSQIACPIEQYDGRPRAIIGNIQYTFDYDSTNHIITVGKYKIPLAKGSVFDWIRKEVQIDVSSIYTEINNARPRVVSVSGGKVYLYKNTDETIASGATMKYWVYNPADDTITSKTFTNTSSAAVNSVIFSAAHGVLCLLKQNVTYTISLFDESDGTHIGDHYVASDTFPSGYGMSTREFSFGEMPQGLINTGFYEQVSGGTRISPAIYDPVNDTWLPCNGYHYYPSNSYPQQYYDVTANVNCLNHRYGVYKWNNPLYFATINNLNSPVTKTSAQTMKVTYTLTEA